MNTAQENREIIHAAVMKVCNLTPREFYKVPKGKGKLAASDARRIAWLLECKYLECSLTSTAIMFNIETSTVWFGIKTIREWVQSGNVEILHNIKEVEALL